LRLNKAGYDCPGMVRSEFGARYEIFGAGSRKSGAGSECKNIILHLELEKSQLFEKARSGAGLERIGAGLERIGAGLKILPRITRLS
jgi:hypothetical protein